MVTDMIQFFITITAAFAAAYFAMHAPGVGGLHGLIAHFYARIRACSSMLPEFHGLADGAGDFRHSAHRAMVVGVVSRRRTRRRQLRRAAHAGGAHRIRRASARSTFHAMHYALRPWPWIIVALASTIVYPSLHDIARAFRTSPEPDRQRHRVSGDARVSAGRFCRLYGRRLFAAYRSTIETHLNWGTSYLVHDFYQRFIRPSASQRELVLTGRFVTVLLMAAGRRVLAVPR